MTALVRFLGLQALSHLSARLPLVWGWLLALLVMLAVNVSPIVTLLFGSWGVHDVVLFYAIENLLLVLTTVVRLMTFNPREKLWYKGLPKWMTGGWFGAMFFGMFFGIFTLVGTIFAAIGAADHGLRGSTTSWLVNVALLVVGHVVSLVIVWFGQGQRLHTRRMWPMFVTMAPRVAALHLFVLLISQNPAPEGIPFLIWLMVGIKVAFDLGVMVVQLLSRLGAVSGPVVADV